VRIAALTASTDYTQANFSGRIRHTFAGRVTSTFALLNDANPTRVQKMMRHQHYATTEIYVEEVQQLLEGTKDAVMQI
jgi:site-specific recombinase XerD